MKHARLKSEGMEILTAHTVAEAMEIALVRGK
jgi:hypothetical protein